MARSQSIPVLVAADNSRTPLTRVHLGSGMHDESWLQSLINDHPQILPIADIEPGFGDLISAAREVPCGHGFIDNLYLTPTGDIVIVETKLWRNSQMRREVVAQALDYVAALTKMSFDAFEKAVARGQGATSKLYDLIADHAEALDEPQFVDAVSLNLKRGRMLTIVLGDGIRTETEALSDLLQSHAGAHFTFALVELATWQQSGTGTILAVPSVLAKTLMIERGIVRIEGGNAVIEEMPADNPQRALSISMSDFWDKMAERDASLPKAIQNFLDALEPLGVYPDLKASLNLKADIGDRDKPVNFGYITKNGQFWLNPASWSLPDDIWRPYFETVASLVDGTIIDEPQNRYVAVNGRSAPRIEQFLPAHQAALVKAIEDMIKRLNEDGG